MNQGGSVLIMISALAAYTRPATNSLVNADIATGARSWAPCVSQPMIKRPGA